MVTEGLITSTSVREKSRKTFADRSKRQLSRRGVFLKLETGRGRGSGRGDVGPREDGSVAPKRVTRQRTCTCPEGARGGLGPFPGWPRGRGAACCRYFELEADGSCGSVLPGVASVGGGSPCGRAAQSSERVSGSTVPVQSGRLPLQEFPPPCPPGCTLPPCWSMEGAVGAGRGVSWPMGTGALLWKVGGVPGLRTGLWADGGEGGAVCSMGSGTRGLRCRLLGLGRPVRPRAEVEQDSGGREVRESASTA